MMVLSTYKVIDPTPLLASIVDSKGNKIIIGDQLDLSEFFLRLIELLETAFAKIEGSSQKIRDLLRGSIQSFIELQNGESVKSNQTELNPLQVGIQKGDLDPALSSQFKYPVEDFEHKGKKQNGMKVEWIDSVPKYLVFTLNRVVLDPKTLKAEKLNNRFTFPLELKMDRYLI